MKNILFVITPYIDRDSNYITPPLSTINLLSNIDTNNCKTNIVDFIHKIKFKFINTQDYLFYDHCSNIIKQYDPDIVIFPSTVFGNFSSMLIIAEKVKKAKKECKIILGGQHSSLHSRYVLENFNFIDFIVYGNSINSAVKLIYSIIHQEEYKSIPNILYREDGKVKLTSLQDFYETIDKQKEIISLLDADSNSFDDYSINNRVSILCNVGYGCGSNCLRCTNCFNRNKHFVVDINLLIESVLCCDAEKVDSIYIYDLFLYTREEIIYFCNQLIERNNSIRWYTRAMIQSIDETLIDLLKSAGCVNLLLGLEKSNNSNSTEKNIDLLNVYKILDYLEKVKLFTTLYLIIGFINDRKIDLIYKISEYRNIQLVLKLYGMISAYEIKEGVLTPYLMRGIDFFAKDVYFKEDLALIEKHPKLFSNFYTYKLNQGFNLFLIYYYTELLRSFRNTLKLLMEQKDMCIRDVLQYIYSSNVKGEFSFDYFVQFFLCELGNSSCVLLEVILYELKNGRVNKLLTLYKDNLFLLNINYDIKKLNNADSYYILRKDESNIKIYQVPYTLYEEIKRNVDHIDNIKASIKELLISKRLY